MSTTPFEVARHLVDESHKRDPAYLSRNAAQPAEDGQQKKDELAYADAMEKWTQHLLAALKGTDGLNALIASIYPASQAAADGEIESRAGELLRLASRCQHLERFLTPRSSYPEGKAGYLKWRRDLYTIQAERAKQLLLQAGVEQSEADWVRKWVSKTDLKPGKDDGDVGTQLLEDAAVLVFLEDELALFAAQHGEYTEQKFIDIIKKTWRKLSPLGKDEALKLSMPKGLSELIKKAIAPIEAEAQGPATNIDAAQNRKKQVSSSAPYTQRALRPKTAAEAEAMLAARSVPDSSTGNDEANAADGEPAFFGARLLKETDEDAVWAHNAWDHVTPPPEHLEMVEQLLAKQAETKLSLDEQQAYHERPASFWDTFYSAHENRFFKDRKWLHLEFPELVEATLEGAPPTTILEVGCGAGNTVFPLLEMNQNPHLTIHACDYSSEAVGVVRSNPLYVSPPNGATCHANVWDLSSLSSSSADGAATPNLPPQVEPGSVDIVVLIFVLSALHPREWRQAVENIKTLLKPDTGLVLLRDYGRHDLPQLRFKKRRMLEDNFYLRGDGTRVYFFTPEELIDIFDATPPPPERGVEVLLPDAAETGPAAAGGDDAAASSEEKAAIADELEALKLSSSEAAAASTAAATAMQAADDGTRQGKTFETVQMAIDRRLLVNRKERKRMYRVWMQAKFRFQQRQQQQPEPRR
ncbi:uncharacterized protein PFL1_06064 [Pseudozyma flocculosa PF-1]|uniref:Related to ABP140 - actin binding protein and AdoMet-dependent tRNA methyltransferase n=2 Tax=Pseudozyma flocculosa TaxID=84751 RepID=A0A5C3F4E6_9BASI|nr:uncharacterized protein PFL1_06064 [Pseudozyma flocculosa PF-1]EPQ26416.1 hypothetical protein PFL1_06064 [Pseudozyma flocculosa PF-1]SPO38990.1 related to ABP140 - actin binding protein and AdoMet-dependent tRNA methyltransferase [Pseudozyma flocculosa]